MILRLMKSLDPANKSLSSSSNLVPTVLVQLHEFRLAVPSLCQIVRQVYSYYFHPCPYHPEIEVKFIVKFEGEDLTSPVTEDWSILRGPPPKATPFP